MTRVPKVVMMTNNQRKRRSTTRAMNCQSSVIWWGGGGGGWKWWVSILSVTAATHGGISHRVVHVLLLQLLRYVRHGGDGGLQVGREDQAEAVGVREPLQVYCTLTPKNKGERASSILCLAARQILLQVWSPMVITTLSTRIFFWIPLMYMLCHYWPK